MDTGQSSPEAVLAGTHTASIEPELRISVKWVIAMLAALGLVLIFIGDAQPDRAYRMRVLYFAVLFYAVSAVAWMFDGWKPWASQWLVVAALVALVHLGSRWLAMPGFLTLMVVPTALAAALFSIPVATAIATGETVLLFLVQRYVAPGDVPAGVAIAVVAVWATLGVVYAVYRPVRQLNEWLWEYSQHTQRLLEEARDRRLELNQALDGLLHMTQQLTLANERMASLRSIAEESLKTKAAFVAKVSHEFRTPLNMIIGLIDLLVETPEVYGQELPPALLEDLEIVHRNCEHLSSMVNDVLDLSRAEAGRLNLHKEQVDLAEVVCSAVTAIRPVLEKKELSLEVVIPQTLPTVYCDRTRIRQVVLNLLSNAAHFTEEGGITVGVAEREQQAIVSVSDTGPGICPEDAQTVFEPFCQGRSRLWRDKGGTGLGLSISKQFVGLHGGQIWLESELGRGTTFSFSLPISPPIAHAARPGYWIGKGQRWVERTSRAGLPVQPLRPCLAICDEMDSLYLTLTHYSDQAELVNVPDLDQLVQKLQQVPAHAILVNAASLERLMGLVEQARQRIPDTPIIGCCVPAQREHAANADSIVSYLTKPVRRAHLEEAIQEVGRPVRGILVVNSDPDDARLLARLLRACHRGLQITTASNGARALNVLRSSAPDLVLLDTALSDMDGWQFLQLKNQDGMTRGIPAILISTQDPLPQPLTSPVLLVAMGEGLPVGRVLRCSLDIPALLFRPD